MSARRISDRIVDGDWAGSSLTSPCGDGLLKLILWGLVTGVVHGRVLRLLGVGLVLDWRCHRRVFLSVHDAVAQKAVRVGSNGAISIWAFSRGCIDRPIQALYGRAEDATVTRLLVFGEAGEDTRYPRSVAEFKDSRSSSELTPRLLSHLPQRCRDNLSCNGSSLYRT